MKQVTTLSGKVSGLRVDSDINVSTTVTNNNVSTSTAVTKTIVFRIDNRPAFMKTTVNLSDGDMVTAAGVGAVELDVLAINNHTTKTMYWIPEPNQVPAIICFVLGVLTLGLFMVGLILIGMGVYYYNDAATKKKLIGEARALVNAAKAPDA